MTYRQSCIYFCHLPVCLFVVVAGWNSWLESPIDYSTSGDSVDIRHVADSGETWLVRVVRRQQS